MGSPAQQDKVTLQTPGLANILARQRSIQDECFAQSVSASGIPFLAFFPTSRRQSPLSFDHRFLTHRSRNLESFFLQHSGVQDVVST